jgi:hypothetical protein
MRSIFVALAIGSAVLAGTGASVVATPSDPMNPVSAVARTSLAALREQNQIPPNPIIPVSNRGAYVSSVAIPTDPIVPTS